MKHFFLKSLGCSLLLLIFLFSGGELMAQKKKKGKDEQQSDIVFDEENNTMTEDEKRRGLKNTEAEYLFTEGMKFFILEDYAKALAAFEECYKLNPQNTTVSYKIAEVLLKQNRISEALPYAQRILKADTQNRYYYTLLASLYEAQENWEEAAKVYKQLLATIKDAEMYYFELANVYLYLGKYEDAIRAYDKAEKHFGVDESVTRQKQKIYLSLHNADGAISEGQKLIEAFPDEVEYYIAQAELLLSYRKADQAKVLLEQALVLSPGDAHVHLLMAEVCQAKGDQTRYISELESAFANPGLDLDAKMNVLLSYYKNVQTKEAQKTGLKLAEMTVKAHPENAKAHSAYGDFLTASKMTRQARQAYTQAVRFDPDNYRIWERIINLDLELKEYDSLVKHSEEVLELFPNQGVFWFYNGLGNYLLNHYDEAIAALEHGKMLSTDNSELQFQICAQLGDAYNGIKDYTKSDKAYDAALMMKPDDPYVLNNYSYFLSLRKDKLEQAKSMGSRLVKIEPENVTYLDTYGWVLYVSGDYKDAKIYLEKAATNSNSGTILEHYGDVLYQLGQQEEAVIQWKKAKALGGELTKDIDRKIADKKLYE